MVYQTASSEPQFLTLNSLQDAFELINRGVDAYAQVTKGANTAVPKASSQPKAPSPAAGPSSPVGTTSIPVNRSAPSQKRQSYQPDLDIFESSDAITIEAALPGVGKSDINIEYDAKANRILLSGTSKRVHAENIKVIRTERPVGLFERVIGLGPQLILPEEISADYKDGVLIITVPLNKVETKRKIIVS